MDFAILNAIQENFRTPAMDQFMVLVTFIGDFAIVWFIAAAILIAFPRYRTYGLGVVLAIVAAALIGAFILKPLFGRERPFLVADFTGLLIAPPRGTSFPSSHSMVSFAAAAALCCLPEQTRGITLLKISAVTIACLIAFSRLYLYVHFPTDVLVGAIVGIAVGIASVATIKKIRTRSLKGEFVDTA